MNLNRVKRKIETREDFCSSVEDIEGIADYRNEQAVLVNNEIIYFGGGTSSAHFEIDEMLWLFREVEKQCPVAENPVRGDEYYLFRNRGSKVLYIYKRKTGDDPREYTAGTAVDPETIEDIKDRFKL